VLPAWGATFPKKKKKTLKFVASAAPFTRLAVDPERFGVGAVGVALGNPFSG
jgi:hypothetical protein